MRGDAELHKLFTVMAQRYAEREGGYTRVLRSRRRANDCAQMAFIECGPLLLSSAVVSHALCQYYVAVSPYTHAMYP